MNERREAKLGGRSDYFAVNDKPRGVSTSFRVSGRLGELGRRFWSFDDAASEAKRLNAAYRLGLKHASPPFPRSAQGEIDEQ